jgi:hypothetical protein
MRVMLLIKGDPEAGAAPSEELLGAMVRYNDELKTAGVLIDLAGLLPSAEGRRVKFSEGNRPVIDGPFPESKELVAGYWILQAQSMDEAVNWAERFPFEAFSRIYPASMAPKSRSRAVRCSSRRVRHEAELTATPIPATTPRSGIGSRSPGPPPGRDARRCGPS